MLAQDVADSLVRRIEKLQSDGRDRRSMPDRRPGRQPGVASTWHGSSEVWKVDPGALELWWTDESLRPTDDPRRNSLQALSRLAGTFPLSPHVRTRCRPRTRLRIPRRRR